MFFIFDRFFHGCVSVEADLVVLCPEQFMMSRVKRNAGKQKEKKSLFHNKASVFRFLESPEVVVEGWRNSVDGTGFAVVIVES